MRRGATGNTEARMQYRTVEQIATSADVVPAPVLSRQARLERWAELLEGQSGWLRAIPEIEYGPPGEREARRLDGSPLALAYADPMLRRAGLRGDRLGDAESFFGLYQDQLHDLVCSCHHGRTVDPSAMARQLRSLPQRPTWPMVRAFRVAAALGSAAAMAALAFF